jgi:hypothetical protein
MTPDCNAHHRRVATRGIVGLQRQHKGWRPHMPQEADPRLIKLVQQLDTERQFREKAEREARGLRAVITRLQRQRTSDAKPEREQRAEC